jgi:hypothetical protein
VPAPVQKVAKWPAQERDLPGWPGPPRCPPRHRRKLPRETVPAGECACARQSKEDQSFGPHRVAALGLPLPRGRPHLLPERAPARVAERRGTRRPPLRRPPGGNSDLPCLGIRVATGTRQGSRSRTRDVRERPGDCTAPIGNIQISQEDDIRSVFARTGHVRATIPFGGGSKFFCPGTARQRS